MHKAESSGALAGGMTRNWIRLLPLAARLIIGAIFIYASIDKVLHPLAFAEGIANYQILPDPLVNPAAVILPWVELLVGLSLVLGVWVPGSALLSTLLLLTFFVAIAFNTARGLNVDCGCFGTGHEGAEDGSMIWYMVRDGTFFFLALYLLFQTLHPHPSKEGEAPPPALSPRIAPQAAPETGDTCNKQGLRPGETAENKVRTARSG